MKLGRRDVLLGAAGAFAGIGVQAGFEANDEALAAATRSDLSDEAVTTLVRVARVVYPSDVSVDMRFVDAYYSTLPEYRVTAAARALDGLDSHARATYGARFGALSVREAETLLRNLGVDSAIPRAHGALAERVRYHVVNGLLYALFTSPRGSRLFGVEHPIGYGGGYHGHEEVQVDE